MIYKESKNVIARNFFSSFCIRITKHGVIRNFFWLHTVFQFVFVITAFDSSIDSFLKNEKLIWLCAFLVESVQSE